MRSETIDRYLDECGITPGEWNDYNYSTINGGDGRIIGRLADEYYDARTDCNVIIASREMLKALIFSGIIMEYGKTATDFPLQETFSGKIIIDSIQKALPGRTWTEIKKRLEELDAV